MLARNLKSVILILSVLLPAVSWQVIANSPTKSTTGPKYNLKIENNTEEDFEIRVVEIDYECIDCDNLLMKLTEPKNLPENFKEIFPQSSESASWTHYKPKTLSFEVYKEDSLLATGPDTRDRVTVVLTRDGKISGPKYDGYYNRSGKYLDFKGKTWVDVEVKWEGNDCVVVITNVIEI